MPFRTNHGILMREEAIATVATAAAKVTPPLTVAGAVVSGATLDNAILWLTAIYLVAQIGYLVWRWVRDWRQKVKA